MNVRELRDRLEECPDNREVVFVIAHPENTDSEQGIAGVAIMPDEKTVVLVGESAE
jgi:hypothetical protein